MKRSLSFALLLLLTGCWQGPPRDWYDLGPDPREDQGPPDMGVDIGDPPPLPETQCDNGEDDDDDELVDCNDFDCAGDPICCVSGSTLINEDWSSPDLTVNWTLAPSADAELPTIGTLDGDAAITGFASDDPRMLIRRACMGLALGAEFTFDVRVAEPGVWNVDCGGSSAVPLCDEYAALVLTAAEDAAPGLPLLDEFAVRIHGASRHLTNPNLVHTPVVRITQGGVQVGRALIEPERTYHVAVRVVPGVADDGRAVLFAVVEGRLADTPDDPPAFELGPFEVIGQRDLLRTDACAAVPGLNVGLEMRERAVTIGAVQASTLGCANPGQFAEPSQDDAHLTFQSLGVPASFAEGGVGAPTLGGSFNSNGDSAPRWDLFFEASNDALELEPFTRVGYALSHARTTVWSDNPLDWDVWTSPRLGSDPPSCVGTGGCSTVSARAPYLLVERGANDVLAAFTLAFAYERPDGSHELRVERNVSLSPTEALGGPGFAVLTPDEAGCEDLSDPALFPAANIDEEPGYWLAYTCERDAGWELGILRLGRDFTPMDGAVAQTWLRPSELSLDGRAPTDIWGPEPLTGLSSSGTRVLRVWFVARARGGATSLMLASAESDTSVIGTVPALVPFPANPVLRSDSEVLGDCDGFCRITGAAVTDVPRTDDELRVVVARRVNGSDGVAMSELIPLTQTWRLP